MSSRPPLIRISTDELVVDSFAGGGGASIGIEQAIGRHVDIAINHDAEALSMHAANHPHTRHLRSDIWEVDPMEATGGKPVALAWFSPDCKHFSKSRGSKPVEKRIRGLAWVAVRWAKAVRPRIIFLENVEEFQEWGPVIPKLDADGKPVIGRDGRPVMVPCPARRGVTFRRFVNALRDLGYRVEWRELRACDFGAPTIRKRLFLVARCDGLPIVWPEPTHGDGRLPYRTAAECMDWDVPAPSIFGRKRPLAEATMKRIARGLEKFVLSGEPFIVRDKAAWVIKHFGGVTGCRMDQPFPTILSKGAQNQLATATLAPAVAPYMVKLRGSCRHGQRMDLPAPTVTAGGNHLGLVNAFLVKYYGTAIGQSLHEPVHTITSKARFGLVCAAGRQHMIADIGMRMLTPRELYRCQGFPEHYEIEHGERGERFTKTAQIRMVGNSVSPPVARAIVRANVIAEVRQHAVESEAVTA